MFLTVDSTVLYTHVRGKTYKSNCYVCYTCHSHVVWSPKYRRKVLVQAIERRLKEMIAQIRQEHQVEMEVMPDQVHLLVSVDPLFGIHRLIKLIKGRSPRLLRQEFPVVKRTWPSLWTHRYFVSTAGGAAPSVIKLYMEQHTCLRRPISTASIPRKNKKERL